MTYRAVLSTVLRVFLSVFMGVVVMLTGCSVGGNKKAEDEKRYQAVLAHQPVGYWPADEGEGDVLTDRSGKGNNGKIYNIPWAKGLLDFTSRYQWIEIPVLPEYQGRSFTLGGWICTRITYINNGMTFIGSAKGITNNTELTNVAFALRIGAKNTVDAVSSGKADALGSRTRGIAIEPLKWQHVMYTFENGNASLYINGSLVQSAAGVAFESLKFPLMIGYESGWWDVNGGSKSLDGTVRDIV
ncbi:MAG TPA: hypothetical protein DD727_04200, partial [Clostridiales bacterium]|nr:hypothetical protein [Clostridiales bacterium]